MNADWRPTATLGTLRLRARVLEAARAFFAERGVLEVETPAMARSATPDPNLESFRLEARPGTYYLQTSPEYPMKRLLAAGFGDCWQLARVFRDGEAGARHLPEFSLLEWYRTNFDVAQMIEETVALIGAAAAAAGIDAPVLAERLTYDEAFRRHAGVGADADAAALAGALARHGVEAPDPASRAELVDLVFGVLVGPRLGTDGLAAVHAFPTDQAALAEIDPGPPPTAARFEIFWQGLELANGFRELRDAGEQARRFEAELAIRRDRGQVVAPTDDRLIAALAHGLPPCSGVALGFDRLVMRVAGLSDVAEAVAFGHDWELR